jgi:imidazole glycerol-phosphate synthase subunit HisH
VSGTRDVVLVDAGGSNIASVQAAFERIGVVAEMTADAGRIARASHVVLPGVGAAGPGMQRLHELGLTDVIGSLRQPVLGVCLGMQLLFEQSEEAETRCLGIIPGTVRRFSEAVSGRVPHMGWNQLQIERPSVLLDGIESGAYAYFVHSYAAPTGDHALASCCYGSSFAAVVARNNFHGAQFHPERSSAVGSRLLKNFLGLTG